jgi:hypothetical protein
MVRSISAAETLKNLARNLATLHGQMRKIGLQGACKVTFFTAAAEQKRTKISQYFIGLRRKNCVCQRIDHQAFNQVVLGSSPSRLTPINPIKSIQIERQLNAEKT